MIVVLRVIFFFAHYVLFLFSCRNRELSAIFGTAHIHWGESAWGCSTHMQSNR